MLRVAVPFRVRWSPPSPAVRSLVEWAFFVSAGVVWVSSLIGTVRTGGLSGLAIAVAVLAVLGWMDRRPAVRRLGVLLVAFAIAYSLRHYADGVLSHRLGRLTISAGLGLHLLLSLPTNFVAALTQIGNRLTANPLGPTAWAVAFLSVVTPVAVIQSNTTPYVWTGDTMPVIPTVVQQYRHGTRDLSSYLPPNSGRERWELCGPGRPYFVRESPTQSGVYSTYPAGMEAFAWPTVVVSDLLGCDIESGDFQAKLEKRTAAILSGVTLALFFLMALRIGTPGGALATTYLLATGSVFASTLGMLLWQQGGVVFWMVVALGVEFHSGGRPGWKGLLLQALACGWMMACRPSAVTFLVPFGIWVFARNWKRGIALPLLAGIAFLPWAITYYGIYRQPFGPAMGFLGEQWFLGENVWAVIASPGRGLLVYQPWMLLIPLLAVRFRPEISRPLSSSFVAFALTTISLHIFLVGSWPMWWGGSCYGSRLAAEVVPIAALLVVRPVGGLLASRGWPVVVAVGILGFAVHAPCLYYDAWNWNGIPIPADVHTERLFDWRDPPFLFHG